MAGKRAAAAQAQSTLDNLLQHVAEASATMEAVTFSADECPGEWEDYKAGSVLRVRLVNFQKYADCRIHPGPFMNMVMGPNGTGKSTIVAALALGLGYAPGVLGRSRDVGEYVRYGSTEAVIELVLKEGGVGGGDEGGEGEVGGEGDEGDGGGSVGGTKSKKRAKSTSTASTTSTELQARTKDMARPREWVAVRRVIRRQEQGASSSWSINGRGSSQAAVQALAMRLGVQADNLCQFMPQDRVADFARMTPGEMLGATEEAVGGGALGQQHRQLGELRRRARALEGEEAREEKTLAGERRQLEALQQQQARAQEQHELQERLRLLRRKLPFVEYRQAREDALAAKRALRDAQDAAAQAVRDAGGAALEAELELLEGEAEGVMDGVVDGVVDGVMNGGADGAPTHADITARADVTARKHFREACAESTAAQTAVLRAGRLHAARRAELERLQGAARELEAQVQAQEAVVAGEEAGEGEHVTQTTTQTRALLQIETELEEVAREMGEIAREGEQLRGAVDGANAQLQALEGGQQQRVERLRRLNAAAHAAHQWLQSNQGRFERPVLGPLGLAVRVREEALAGVVESVVSKQCQVTFLCQTARDLDVFLRCVCDEQQLPVSCTCLEGEGARLATHVGTPAQAQQRAQQLARLGFDAGSVLDALDGPEPVLAALCEMARVHRIPVARQRAEALDLAACQRVPGLGKFAAADLVFELRRSRYRADDVAIRSAPHKPPFLLAGAGAEGDAPALHDALQRARAGQAANQQRSRELLARQQRLRAQLDAAHVAVDARNAHARRLLAARALLRKLRLQRDMQRTRAAALQDELRAQGAHVTADARTAHRDALARTATCVAVLARAAGGALPGAAAFGAVLRRARVRDRIHALRQQLEAVRALVAQRHSHVREREATWTRAHAHAQQLLGAIEAADAPEPGLEAAFAALPEPLDELVRAVAEAGARVDALGRLEALGAAGLRDLDARAAGVRRGEAALQALRTERAALDAETRALAACWLPAVAAVVARVSAAFSGFFARLQCRGEVRLRAPEAAPEDYDAYALDVLVAFRADEPLQRLSAHRQSGGEKSVATVLYLLALQELARSPFRVVDEINQGMDVANERRVHAIIVDAATGGAAGCASQYFLITPKLLAGLHYHERVQVLCVYSGPGVPRLK